MTPLRIEADECGYCWTTGPGIHHRCVVALPGDHLHRCFCGVCE